jgi:hypothetical protein
MGFSQSNAAKYQEGIVGFSRVFAYCVSGIVGEDLVITFNVIIKIKAAFQL